MNSSIFQKTGLLLLLSILFHTATYAQVATDIHFLPETGSETIYACSGILYDAGGNGDCPYSASGYTIIYPVATGCHVRLQGTYDLEDRLLTSDDVLTIYDGAGTTGTTLFSGTGSGSLNVVSTTGPLTVKMTTHASDLLGVINASDGFELTISCDGGCECSVPSNIIVSQGTYGVDISWTGTSPSYIIEYGPAGFTPGTGTTVIANGNSYTVMGLTTYATYDFYIYYDCGNDGVVSIESPGFVSFCVPDGSSCIDFSDLTAPNITCTTGFTNVSGPYTTVGVVDNGPSSSSSQHTIHRTMEYDPRTSSRLATIPPCELYSVRLGNWEVNYGCESVSYDYTVDTTVGDILLLKYASVLQNPGHSATSQPRFDFEILDQNSQQIDAVCGYASFISNVNLGWNQVGSGDNAVLWKDWTNVGFDVTAYHGQTVRVRLTTYDCNEGGHYGYAYFTLNCKKKAIIAESCGETPVNTYTAPSGFNYNWYFSNNPSVTISTDQSVTVSSANQGNLNCHVSFLNNPNCGFELHTSLTARYPLADFTLAPDSCGRTYIFTNNSSVSYDGVTPGPNNEPCETAHWNFGDGTTSDAYSPSHTFPSDGTYTITLVSGLSGDACQDSISTTITINTQVVPVPFNASICQGDSYDFNGQIIFEEGVYRDTLPNSQGCDSISELHLRIIPADPIPIEESICPGDSFNLNGRFFSEAGVYLDTVTTQLGCDSIIELHLSLSPVPTVNVGDDQLLCGEAAFPVTVSANASGNLSYQWNTGATTQSLSVSQAGNYSVTVTNEYGCTDSDEMEIRLKDPITLTVEATEEICTTGVATLVATTNAPNVEWNTGETSHGIEVTTTGTYIVRAYDGPCEETDTIELPECPPLLEFPNIITPNGDGSNDVFAIVNLDINIPNYLVVYNRWGKKVFEKENYQTYARDGIIYNAELGFTAEKLSDGVYYYAFHYEGKVYKLDHHGTITVIR